MEIRISSEVLLKILWIASVVCSMIGFILLIFGVIWAFSADGLEELMRGVAILASGLALSVVPRSLTISASNLLGPAEKDGEAGNE